MNSDHVPFVTMMMSGSVKRHSFCSAGRRKRVMTRRRRRAILRLVMVKRAPKRPPQQPSTMAGRNMMTLTGIAFPACSNNNNRSR